MNRKDSVLKKLSENRQRFRAFGVEELGVFGSVAKGTNTAESDVDIIVSFASHQKSSKNFNAICDLLDELIGEPYDIVTREGLSPYFGPEILKEAIYVELAS
ncbi:nucleotidyltransferase family protein [Puniceicoccus vermicola]|uniref:Nucleotidyltransferase domain-containing protein n=1 Tax=Puniceicoccus vermicola TaxID=388746 RepID=A0A7X1AWE5_9BACT|nr:nucleotidyltransferase domain-containing protein [Puniceicoccus vermicola]MBC2601241.1 nucleotidyltransferase domain-containing protein [Puniceicoccus vermicola]